MNLVKWDTLKDGDGNPMLEIYGFRGFTQATARQLADEILDMLSTAPPNSPVRFSVRFCCPHCHMESDFSSAVKPMVQG
jgi:hypothetical protein